MLSLRRNLGLTALASLATIALPVHLAFGDPPVGQVNVVNPATNPVPTTVLNPATNPVPATVLNPATMPALTSSVDDPGRIPYQSTVFETPGASDAFINFPFTAVPQGHRLVIQYINGGMDFTGTPSVVQIAVNTRAYPGLGSFDVPFLSFGGSPAITESQLDRPVQFYVDAGDQFVITAGAFGGAILSPGTGPHFTITGYMLDCTASPCAAIAH